MKLIKKAFISLVFLFWLINNGMVVWSMNTGFFTEELSKQEKDTFVSNIDLCILKSEPHKETIKCFDVNQNNEIAIVFNKSDKKTVCVYNENMFLYGFTFNCSGDVGVEWDETNINIYFVRSDVIISVTPKGEILDVAKVQNSIENNSYVNYFIYSRSRIVGDIEYTLRNDIGILNVFTSSYSQIIAENSAGEETILYNVNSIQFIKTLTLCVVSIVVLVMAVTVIIREFAKFKH